MIYRVLKFGGTSMGSAQMIQASANIVQSQSVDGTQIWCVVSAMSGVTNGLYALIEKIKEGKREEVDQLLDIFQKKHFDTLAEIVGAERVQPLWDAVFSGPFSELMMIAE